MSRRAAIRREQKDRKKAEKNDTANGEMQRAAEQGRIDGRTMAFCVVADFLYEVHGFRKKRIEEFLQKSNKESLKYDNEGMQLVLNFYGEKVMNRMKMENVVQKPDTIIDHVYLTQRDMFYVSAIALMMAVLNESYGMAVNDRKNGRLDILMDYCAKEYTRIQTKPEIYTAEYFVAAVKRKTGITL